MGIALVIALLLVVGYAFAECGRFIATRRRPNPELPYSPRRLQRRLTMSLLLLLELGLIALRLYVFDGPTTYDAFVLFMTAALLGIAGIFWLVHRDLAETRQDIRAMRAKLREELLSGLPVRSDDERRTR